MSLSARLIVLAVLGFALVVAAAWWQPLAVVGGVCIGFTLGFERALRTVRATLGTDPTMLPPPPWWTGEQWRAALAAVAQCRCDPYDCGPYGHDDGCPAAVLSQGQYNAVKERLPTISRRPL